MDDDVFSAAYRLALSTLSRNVDLPLGEWVNVPHLLRAKIRNAISDGETDPSKIAGTVVGEIRQSEQIQRSSDSIAMRQVGGTSAKEPHTKDVL